MIIESLLEWPALNAHSKKRAISADPDSPVNIGRREERNAITAVQWLVAIGVSYLVVAVNDRHVTEPLPAILIVASLASAAFLQRVPEIFFEKHLIEPGLLVLDSILILSAITTSHEMPWDLLILFFFCVFIATIGENLIQVALGCILLSLVFVMFVSPNVVDISNAKPDFLFRVPFMFGISIFYGHLANQVKEQKKRAERIEEAALLKRQMVCALAHDIKTPLNVILGHAELIADPSGGYSTPTEKLSSLKSIRENVDRIARLITDLLDVSKTEMLNLQATTALVQVNAVAEDVVRQQTVMAREKDLELALKLDAGLEPIFGDFNQLHRAVANLVSNAIKFTPRGGRVTVSSQMTKKNIVLTVRDTGIGIPAEEISSLFSEFQRLSGSANTEGSGLGLFIVKTLVEAHGGSVAVESEIGAGTTFTILLPTTFKPGATLRRAA